MSSTPEPITLPDGTAVPEKWIGTYKGAIACETAVCGWLKTPHDKVGRWIALSTPDDNLISLISDLAHAEAANQKLREKGQALLDDMDDGPYPGYLNVRKDALRKALVDAQAGTETGTYAFPQPAIGNVLDRWEQLPNDIRSDPGFDALNAALTNLYHAVILAGPKGEAHE